MLFMWRMKDGRRLRMKQIDDNLLREIIYEGCYKNNPEMIYNTKYLTRKRINRLFQEAYSRRIYPAQSLLCMHQQALANVDLSYSYPRYKVSKDGKCIII